MSHPPRSESARLAAFRGPVSYYPTIAMRFYQCSMKLEVL